MLLKTKCVTWKLKSPNNNNNKFIYIALISLGYGALQCKKGKNEIYIS